jgi:hypothetical protein
MINLPDAPIKVMLGWANESWTGIWHGLSDQVIFEQLYNREELDNHAKLLAKYFQKENYLKINGKSPFLLYKPRKLPKSKDYLEELRDKISKYGGGEVYIIGTWGPGISEQVQEPSLLGLDSVVANNVGPIFRTNLQRLAHNGFWTFAKSIGLGPEIRDYLSTIKTLEYAHESVNGTVHSSVVTGWDNTPRSKRRGLVLNNFKEGTFRQAVQRACQLEQANTTKLMFVKSWNEWAEGNTIEPRFNEDWSIGAAFKDQLGRYES